MGNIGCCEVKDEVGLADAREKVQFKPKSKSAHMKVQDLK